MAAWNFRGAWAPNTAYATDDAYTEAGSTYGVTSPYTSGAAFDSTDTSHASVLAQAGAQGPVGPAGTVTATGANGNFDVPGLLTNEGGYQTIVTRTTPSGPVSGELDVTQVEISPTFSGSGFSLGNSGGWTVHHTLHEEPKFLQRGISHSIDYLAKKFATGDHAGIYGYVRGVAGTTAQSDEGNNGASFHVTDLSGEMFHGTLTQTVDTGSTSLPLAGSGVPVDGGFLLNLTSGVVAGSLTGDSIPLTNTFLNYLPTTGGLPQTEAWGIATAAIPNPGCTADSPVKTEVTVVLQPITRNDKTTTPGFATGDVVSVAGNWYPEQALIFLADNPIMQQGQPTTQRLEIFLRNPNQKAILFKGGVAGSYISFDANLLFSGVRSSYYAFGSLNGTDLIYGVNRIGNLEGNYLPQPNQEAARSTGDSAGFHLYRGAEVVKGPSSAQSLDLTLEANRVVWNANDQVASTAGAYFSGNGLLLLWQSDSPGTASQNSIGIQNVALGKNVSSAYQAQRTINLNPAGMYQAFSGPLAAPTLHQVDGIWNDWFLSTTPLGTLFRFERFANDNQTVFGIFNYPQVGGEFYFRRDLGRYHADKFRTSDLLVEGPILAASLKVNYDTEVGPNGIIMPDVDTGVRMRLQIKNGQPFVTVA